MLRNLYNWVLSWSEKKQGSLALSILSFAEASFFPVPPDPLLVALCLGKPKRSFWFAFLCSMFSVFGAVLGYYIGLVFWDILQDFFFSYILKQSAFDYVKNLYHQNSFIAIITAAFTPIPYKAFTIAAGVFKVDLIDLLAASAIGRSARFFLEAGLIYFYGMKIKNFIDSYFNILTVAITLIIIALIIIYKLL